MFRTTPASGTSTGSAGLSPISVGHCHPHVVAAANRQNETIQHSTTLYLQPKVAEFAEALAAKMPGRLKVCYFVNSGSEANDLALLMARLYTGNYDAIALRNGYHGGSPGTMGLTAQSSWKFNTPHAFGVHHALAPYPYRGRFGYDDPGGGAQVRRRRQEPDRLLHAGEGRRLHRRVDPGCRRLRRVSRGLPEARLRARSRRRRRVHRR
jgi:4-aminobutyrate aminotransferase-like enzyme